MVSVAKQVKKAINEGEYRNDYSSREEYEDEGLDVQGDTEEWISGIKHFMEENKESEHTLPLLATIINFENYDEDERGQIIAEALMLYVKKYSNENLPPFDEVFIDSVAWEVDSEWMEDWKQDVIDNYTIDAYKL